MVYCDRELPEMVFKVGYQHFLFFDQSWIFIKSFLGGLLSFMKADGDDSELVFVSLDPHADDFFQSRYEQYGVVVASGRESAQTVCERLEEEIAGHPGASMEILSDMTVAFPTSGRWCIWTDRAFSFGALASGSKKTLERMAPLFYEETFKPLAVSPGSKLNMIAPMEYCFENRVIPDDFVRAMRLNYGGER